MRPSAIVVMGRFDDHTAVARIAYSGYAMGVLTADYDNDGG